MTTMPQYRRMRAEPVRNPLAEYLPDILFGLVMFCISISRSAFGVGPIPALVWLGCAVVLMLYRYHDVGAAFFRWWMLLALPIWAFLSFLWSDLPDISARYGFQVFMTAFFGVFVARILTPARFVTAVFIGMFFFCAISIASGRTGVSETGPVLIGLTGSKNAMGFAGALLLPASIAVICLRTSAPIIRFMGLLGVAVGAYVVAVTASATAVVVSAAAGGMLIVMAVMQPMSSGQRALTIIAFVLLLSPLMFLTAEINDVIAKFTHDVLHKDSTLTGRTYLWAHADELIARRPLLGYGFQAMWLGESADTIGILRWAGITDGRTFNFHNTYRQIAVDVGFSGVLFFVVSMGAALIGGIRQFILHPTVPTSFCFIMLAIIISKTYTELVIGAFSMQTLVLYACCVYALSRSKPEETPAASPPPRAQRPKRRPTVRVTT